MLRSFFVLVLIGCFSPPLLALDPEPRRFDLPELTIDAERTCLSVALPFSHEEIPSASLELKYAPTPNDQLRMNPSITMPGSMKGMGGAPSIRGFPNYSNQVLLDGTSMTMPWANWSYLLAFPFRRLQKVTVVKGGPSLVYGSSGLAGAINLTLPQGSDLPGLRITEEIGNQSTRHQEVLYGQAGESNQHLFGYFGDETLGDKRHSERETGALLYRGSVEAKDGWRFRLGLFEMNGRIQLPDLGDSSMTPQDWDQWDMSHRDFVAEKDFGNDRQLSLRLYRNAEFSHNTNYTDYSYSTASGTGSTDMAALGREVIFNLRLGGKHRIAVGWQGRSDRESDQSVGNVERELDTNGFFLSDFIDCTRRVNLHLAARADHHSVAGSENSWSAEATWKMTDETSLNVGASRLARFPVMRELYMTFIGAKNKAGTFVASIPGQGDPTNQAEKSRTTEVTLRHRINDRWQVSLGRFVSEITDLIDRVNNPGWPKSAPRFWWRNLTTIDLAGWEGRLEGEFNRNLKVWMGYTRQEEADNTATGNRLDERPFSKFNGGLVWQRGRTRSLLTWERRGAAPYIQTGSGKSLPASLAAATQFDLTVRRQLSPQSALYVSVANVGDADIEAQTHVIGAPPVYETPRRAILGLETQF